MRDKRALIELLRSHLEEELREAAPGSERTGELERQILMYRFLPLRELGAEDVASPAALVELELEPGGVRSLYFIVPGPGGLVTRFEGQALQVVGPNSPIGEALMGRKIGDRIAVDVREGVRRTYRVVSIE